MNGGAPDPTWAAFNNSVDAKHDIAKLEERMAALEKLVDLVIATLPNPTATAIRRMMLK